jgi:subtilase family serine protease
MQRFTHFRYQLGSLAALFCLLAATFGVGLFAGQAYAVSNSGFVLLNGSFISAPTGTHLTGTHTTSQKLTITLVLQSSKETQMNNLLTALYDPNSSQYHHWLTQGEFNRLFAPTAKQTTAVTNYLTKAGMSITSSPSPFLVRAIGSTAQIETTFHTQINNYRAADGETFFQNDSNVSIPGNLASLIIGVSGLSNTVRIHPNYVTTSQAAQAAGHAVPSYGDGPGGSGLTPSQTSSLYDATPVYNLGDKGKGKGAKLAVFELSGYTASDITNYEHQFFGSSEKVKLVNINVDGGPVNGVCPTSDVCAPDPDFSGDIEVDADIETQISLAPKISEILVYNAPNDEFGITSVNEYFKIASDDLADSISTSWGLCEMDLGLGGAEAESVAFMEMAAQGQSMFSASGDTGAFGCLRGSGFPGVQAGDPGSQPFVTGVGGTSLGTFDPGTTKHPAYPNGAETVWNVADACSATNLNFCSELGAGGGAVSSFWPLPSYQHGPGVISSFSEKAPFCVLATKGQSCREEPDVSANADEVTPYAEFCTGSPTTNSTCASFSASQPVPGWFGIGGTSLSSPVWSSVIALWDSVHGTRFGNANVGLYQLFRSKNSYNTFFHDITGKHQTENNNGFYPTTPNYDIATGIGTPRIAGIAEHKF